MQIMNVQREALSKNFSTLDKVTPFGTVTIKLAQTEIYIFI
jgi:hypothetical protein